MKQDINRFEIIEKITPLIENTAMRFNLIPIEIEFIKEKVQTLVSCFKKVITNWISLRTDSQVDASKIMAVIDNEVRNGITILNNENIEKGGRIR